MIPFSVVFSAFFHHLNPTARAEGVMNGEYPRFKTSYLQEELSEHFLLGPAEIEFVRNRRGDANRQGIAILLKSLPYLGYFPEISVRRQNRQGGMSESLTR
jgi:hypothetical protein